MQRKGKLFICILVFLAPVLLEEAAPTALPALTKPEVSNAHHKASARRLPDYFPSIGPGMPSFNQYNMPGAAMDPLLYSSPFFPRFGSQSMIPPPPAIFHYGELPIQSIYALHYPTAFTPNSLYGLPHVYNPYFGMNMPYSYLHHPYAAQIVNNLSYMNQNMADPAFGLGGFPGPAAGYTAGFSNMNALGPTAMMGVPGHLGSINGGFGRRKLEELTEQPIPVIKLDKKVLKGYLRSQEKHFAKTIAQELQALQQAIKAPKTV